MLDVHALPRRGARVREAAGGRLEATGSEMQPLYNREGRAIAYIADNEVSVYRYDGGPAGWIHQGCVYAYSGKFLGWVMYGWVCDPEGYPAFFTDRSQGGPRRPTRQPRPVRAPREFRPQRATRWGRPVRPGMKNEWSKRSDESFFAGGPGEEEQTPRMEEREVDGEPAASRPGEALAASEPGRACELPPVSEDAPVSEDPPASGALAAEEPPPGDEDR